MRCPACTWGGGGQVGIALLASSSPHAATSGNGCNGGNAGKAHTPQAKCDLDEGKGPLIKNTQTPLFLAAHCARTLGRTCAMCHTPQWIREAKYQSPARSTYRITTKIENIASCAPVIKFKLLACSADFFGIVHMMLARDRNRNWHEKHTSSSHVRGCLVEVRAAV